MLYVSTISEESFEVKVTWHTAKYEESAVHSPPHLQFLMARDSNPQPMDYESDSLTIRPRLPPQKTEYTEYLRTGS